MVALAQSVKAGDWVAARRRDGRAGDATRDLRQDLRPARRPAAACRPWPTPASPPRSSTSPSSGCRPSRPNPVPADGPRADPARPPSGTGVDLAGDLGHVQRRPPGPGPPAGLRSTASRSLCHRGPAISASAVITLSSGSRDPRGHVALAHPTTRTAAAWADSRATLRALAGHRGGLTASRWPSSPSTATSSATAEQAVPMLERGGVGRARGRLRRGQPARPRSLRPRRRRAGRSPATSTTLAPHLLLGTRQGTRRRPGPGPRRRGAGCPGRLIVRSTARCRVRPARWSPTASTETDVPASRHHLRGRSGRRPPCMSRSLQIGSATRVRLLHAER